MPLAAIPVGTIIHNVELKPGDGRQDRALGRHLRAAGRPRMPATRRCKLTSGEVRMVRAECMATIGAVSNPDNTNEQIGKAGRTPLAGPHAAQTAAS